MARHSKSRPKLGSKAKGAAASADKQADAADDEPRDPLRAYPADPPRPQLALLVMAAVLFALWFCYLAYVAIGI